MNPRPQQSVSPLIVSLDFEGSAHEQRSRAIEFAKTIAHTGVIVKVNSVLRATGMQLIHELHELGLYVFCDLKLNDIPSTLERDAQALYDYDPEYVTVMCSAGSDALARVKQVLSRTEVVAVGVLSSFSNADRTNVYGLHADQPPFSLMAEAIRAQVRSVVMSVKELNSPIGDITKHMSMNHIVPGVRFEDNQAYDQFQITTPKHAVLRGANQLIVGRPIVEADDPVGEIERFLEAIHEADKALLRDKRL